MTDLSNTDRSFSPAGYQALLRELKARGFQDVPLAAVQKSARHVVLRHDVDLCLESAARLADIEAAEGMRSTYYVLVNTEMYNPASRAGRDAMARIVRGGHALGLHFDAGPHPGTIAAMDAAAAQDCAILEAIVGRPVESISFHRPAPELIGFDGALAGRPHSYQPRFFSDLVYISDSEGRWRHGHPLDHPGVRNGKALQLLIHPIWWTSDADTVIAKLEAFRAAQAHRLRREMAANLKPFAARFGKNGENAPPS